MKRAIAAEAAPVHPADCACRRCPPRARARLSPANFVALMVIAGFAAALSALVIVDWLAGGPGVQVMFGYPGRY